MTFLFLNSLGGSVWQTIPNPVCNVRKLMFANISGYVFYICYIVIFSAESLMYRVVVLGEEAGAAMQMNTRQRNLLITQEAAKL